MQTQRLLAVTALYIAGQWLKPGADVPLTVANFDYAKAYRKGMLAPEDGSEFINPVQEQPSSGLLVPLLPTAGAAAVSSDEAELRTQANQLTREREQVQQELDTTRHSLGTLQNDLQTAQDALKPWEGLEPEQVRTDLAALAEYRDTLGELLPATFPGRAKLFAHGYYTTSMLEGVTKDELLQVKGVADATAEAILAALPAAPAEQPDATQQPAAQG